MELQFSRRIALLGSGLATAAVAAGPLGLGLANAQPGAPVFEVEDLGELALETIASYAQDFQVMDDGSPALFMGVNGAPVTVAKVDPFTLEVDWQLPLEGSDGGTWGVRAQPDGTVFAGSWSNGVIYRKAPGADSFESLGRPAPGVTWIWDLALDGEGSAYIAAHFNGETDARVYRWTESEGFRDYAAVVPGAANIQTLDYHEGLLYAGSQPVNDVVVVDVETGEVSQLPDPPTPHGRLQDLRVVDGILWVHEAGARTIAFDLESETWLSLSVTGFGRGISNTGPDGRVYVDSNELGIVAVDPVTGQYDVVGEKPEGETFMMEWMEGPDGQQRLFGVQSSGNLLSYGIGEPGLTVQYLSAVEGALAIPRALTEGPSGEVWASSYMVHNHAPYFPETATWGEQIVSIKGQGDAMASDGELLWVGTYSGALLWRYDPSLDEGEDNPVQVHSMSGIGQDRIHALAATDGLVIAGSVPNYGQLGGALLVHDPAADTTSEWRNLIADQSIVSVLLHDGLVYVGSSVYGGLGITPTQEDAVVAAVDPATGEVVRSWTPVPGQKAIRQIVIGPDGALWGLAGGELFRSDLATGESSVLQSIVPVDWASLDHQWEWGYLTVNPVTGELNGSAGVGNATAKIFTYDVEDDELTILASGVDFPFAQHSSGDLYWVDGYHLMRATLDRPEQTPSPDPSDEPSQTPSPDPSDEPTSDPSDEPTSDPSDEPTSDPSDEPTSDPSDEPTSDPSDPSGTASPTDPESDPSRRPHRRPGLPETGR